MEKKLTFTKESVNSIRARIKLNPKESLDNFTDDFKESYLNVLMLALLGYLNDYNSISKPHHLALMKEITLEMNELLTNMLNEKSEKEGN